MKKNLLFLNLLIAITACSKAGSNVGIDGGGDALAGDVTREFKGIIRSLRPNNALNLMHQNESGATSQSYRIPAVILTKNNRLIVTSDARWGGSADSANNIDSVYRYSDDGGQTWTPIKFFQHFDDFADVNNRETGGDQSQQTFSASFIDPGIVEAPNGDIVAITTVFPWGGGLFNNAPGQTKISPISPYFRDGLETYLRLRHKDNTGDRTIESTYEYRVKLSGNWSDGELRDVTLADGSPIIDSDKQFKVDKFYDVYHLNGTRVMVDQYTKGNSTNSLEKSGAKIEVNLLYYESPYHVTPRNMLFMARSTNGGATFAKPFDVSWHVFHESIMIDRKQWFTGVSPGVGFKDRKGRILFAIQQVPNVGGNGANGCQAISMYSDDNGNTWKLGINTINLRPAGQPSIDRFSESQYLATPDPNQLILIGRTKPNRKVMYAVSMDRGIKWSDPTNTVLGQCGNIGSMVGAANLYKSTLFGQPMIAITHVGNASAQNDAINIVGRQKGTMSLGYLKEGGENGNISFEGRKVWVPTFDGAQYDVNHTFSEGDNRFWTYANNSNPREEFAYSMPIELPNGNIGWFYEGQGYQGGRANPSYISWQEVRLDRTGGETSPIFSRP
ncbi:MAG: hypothetical protein ACRCWI_08140 [Brevinema sp.]